MINVNGTIQPTNSSQLTIDNRGYTYGDALFETIKVVNGKILFWEDHYFRLMASMRILRMEIPMNFTMEFLESEILKTVQANQFGQNASRIRLNVHRKSGGKYLPKSLAVEYNITAQPLGEMNYIFTHSDYQIELYKDYFVSKELLSTLKTNNKIINILGSIFADENGYHNCLLLNTDKKIVEALNANLFLVKNDAIITPPIEDGCLKGVMRKQVMEIVKKMENFELLEQSLSPFELQQADELFLTNVIVGIQPVTRYRKKEYKTVVAKSIFEQLNLSLKS